jgi:uncharacterized membrane protein YfcA
MECVSGLTSVAPEASGVMRVVRFSLSFETGGVMWFVYIILGLVAGTAGGLFGIGGGIILIPAMVYLFGLTEHQAQGTTLAILVPPIGILAAIKYYMEGNVKIGMAVFICLGFLFGGLIGAQLAHKIPDLLLKRLFGIIMLIISLKMVFSK